MQDIGRIKNRLEELEAISSNADFWKNSNKAKVIMKEKQSIEKDISTYQNLKQRLATTGTINVKNMMYNKKEKINTQYYYYG